MSALSKKLQALALSKINQFGEDVSFSREAEGTYDPYSGNTLPTETITYTGKGVPENFNENEKDGTIIQQGDLKLNVAQLTSQPKVGDEVTLTSRSDVFRIVNVNIVPLNGDNIIYILQLR
jgi:hypothetical protein